MSDPDYLSGLNGASQDSALDPQDEVVRARLLVDGALWRNALPSTALLADAVRRLAAETAQIPPRAPEREDIRVSNPPVPTLDSRSPRPAPSPRRVNSRVRGAIAVIATLALVALFVAVFHGVSPAGTSSNPATTPSASATPTAPLHNIWTQPPTLSTLDAFPVQEIDDAQIIYLGGATLRRSSDTGATWQNLPLPSDFPTNNGYSWVDVFVSPTNADTVFATANLQVGATCPKLSPQSSHIGAQARLGGSVPCNLQWVSQDGGQTWKPIQVNVSDFMLGSVNATRYFGSPYSAAPQAIGSSLYSLAGIGPSAAFPGFRIVKSTDGGVSWSSVDSQLHSDGFNICDYAADSASNRLFAVVTPQDCGFDSPPPIELWSSSDGGAHWSQVSLPKQGLEENALVVNGTLYLALAIPSGQAHVGGGTLDATGFFASHDGGNTWEQSPATGVATGSNATYGTVAPYGSGILVPFSDNNGGPAKLYTWSSGLNQWNAVATAQGASVLALQAYQNAPGSTDIDIWLTYQGFANNSQYYGMTEYVP